MNYVISDIHGAYDKFISILKLINFSINDTLYILGDCIDRGNDGIKVLQYIMKKPNIKLFWGNHEKLMMDFIDSGSGLDKLNWFYNGGSVTYNNLNLLPSNEKEQLLSFIRNLPYYEVVDKYILCHAGIRVPENSSSMDINSILKSQDIKDLLWIREDFYDRKAIDGYTVIFGHTPSTYIEQSSKDDNGEFCAWHDNKFKDKICIDCWTAHSLGRLCCIRLDDLEEFYV